MRVLILLLPAFLLLEVGVPWVWRIRYFPMSRAVLGVLALPFKKPALISTAQERLTQAQHRLTAAQADLKAAELEAEATALEEQTNNMREGKE